jgi:hypothetical protein
MPDWRIQFGPLNAGRVVRAPVISTVCRLSHKYIRPLSCVRLAPHLYVTDNSFIHGPMMGPSGTQEEITMKPFNGL